MPHKLTIIVISYNSFKTIEHCILPTLTELNLPVIFVDNASSDDSAELLKQEMSNASVIALPSNIGYGRAANRALAQVKTPYALLLNPDILASAQDVLGLLQYALNDTGETAIWGPKGKHTPTGLTGVKSVNEINGSAMLLDLEKLRPLGFFDENIFLFCEEHDLCARARAADYQILECCAIDFGHLEGQSCGSSQKTADLKNWHFGWSFAYFQSKHFPSSAKKDIAQKLRGYRRKSWLQLNKSKRREFHQKVIGIKAFLNGIKAFDHQNRPKGTD